MSRYEDSGQVVAQFDEVQVWAQPGERVIDGGYTITGGSQYITIAESARITGLGDNGDTEGWNVRGVVEEGQLGDITVWCETPG
jgi:hypothetical protein